MTTYLEIPIIGKVKHGSRWVIGLLAASMLVVGTATTYTVVNRLNNKEDISQLTVGVQAKDITVRITASGKVQPIQNVNISPKNPGLLTHLYVEQGDKVKAGQIIARMDSADIEAQVDQALADGKQAEAKLAEAVAGNRPQEIAKAQAQVDSAKAKALYTSQQVKRYQYLYQQGAEKKQLLDQAISDDNAAGAALREAEKQLSLMQSGTRTEEIAQNQAAVDMAKAKLKAAQVKLEDTVIRAPFSGVVTQKYANIGAFVTPTTSASVSASATSSSIIALAKGLEVLAQVPEIDIGRIKQGQQVEIVADAYPDQVFKGHVRLIAPEAVKDEGVTLFQIRIAIDSGLDKLRSGLNVNLTFFGDQLKNALLVPTVAIVTEKGNTGVLIPDAKNKPLFHYVTIGSQIKDQTQILEGVKQGDLVFINPPPDYRREQQAKQK
ncbi:efflux RND transporter periplasmic adaptor subunit [Aetokthonos hydrillicola Thurmond2011]|jgi:HlyD family secretion protein|uniref:Efflux RND transporter periplasmic adaptor subunit n=1 Tax=Aetokthonos hydrillicola Thurmond2011 TaxID=2712845 RepID=A0AAP5MBR3_9CYAN|nr:efflux RND transporter periplasmic adaptor subunit [Aetokthonos hydrillicola]MBO3463042.1 efflux RND transporter periplasmic adaptor subunit [Aetokthonos hydrillicola CCALA 1050]MBW4588911.1 efflux RND transporter periplasmic adaptor subunit [Aetokthonos hydrillicola CCALA 1050]MDR9898262.1 efflux RND transporter periplasmic adaptor subunit [Aetokthonos hydrillicola Thurmond2011]